MARLDEMKHSVYMTWAKRHAAARFNLANSGMLPCAPADIPIPPGGIEFNGRDPEGYPPLREAIAAKYGVTSDRVVPAQGTSGANFLACATLLERGDEVLVERPAYEPLLAVVRYLGAEVKRFERSLEDGYRLDIEAIRGLLSPRVKLVVLTSPHNPSGVVADPGDLQRLAGLCAESGAWLMVDEVYRDILFEDAPPSAAHLGDRALATGSLTKSYGLGGLRCGWILCEENLAERMRRMNDLMGVMGPRPAEMLGWSAFRALPTFEKRTRSLIEPNTRLAHRFIEEHADLLECVVPTRSVTLFPRLKSAASADLLHERLRARDTSIVPGRFFEAPQHFRLGFGVSTDDVSAGLLHLSEVLRELASCAES
ncbi:MAG TPA: pyridoxal phosphate-dependent aminotransferase [Candidatus Polarisedimenticolia bacterium]|nr:pyridoxal phosphate-dependent aminotransferase [Candidatus Polarisedimenticolia bacterium]